MVKLRTDDTIPLWEHIFVIVGLFIFANAFREVDIIGRYWNYLRMLYFGVIAVVVALRLRHFVPTTIKATSIILLTFMAVLSFIWSDAPRATLSRSIALIMLTVFSIYFAGRYPLGSQMRIIAVTMVLFGVLSTAFALFSPDGTEGSAWNGIFTQKNVFGRIMLIAAIIALTYRVETPTGARWKFLAFFSLVMLIFLSDSMTSLVILFAVTMAYSTAPTLRLKPVQSVAFFFAAATPMLISLYMVATVDTDEILIALGRDPTLTGRAEAWENLDLAIQDRFFTGYGYGAFFNHWSGTYGDLFSQTSGWSPGSAHHNYRDVWLNVGVVGVALFVISNVVLTIRSLFLIRQTNSSDGVFPFLMMVYFIILGFSESFVLYTEIFWVLYVSLAFSLADALPKPEEEEAPERVPYTSRRDLRSLEPDPAAM